MKPKNNMEAEYMLEAWHKEIVSTYSRIPTNDALEVIHKAATRETKIRCFLARRDSTPYINALNEAYANWSKNGH